MPDTRPKAYADNVIVSCSGIATPNVELTGAEPALSAERPVERRVRPQGNEGSEA